MTIRLVELGDDRHGIIRAVEPAPGRAGQRQVGWALPLLDEGRAYLVRVPGRRARRVGSRGEAAAVLLRQMPL